MQIRHIPSLEGNSPAYHCKEHYSQTPEINAEATIALISDDLRSDVSGSATLIFNELVFSDDFTDSKITDLDCEICVDQDIIEFHISVNDRARVDVTQPIHYLFEDELRLFLLKSLSLLHEL